MPVLVASGDINFPTADWPPLVAGVREAIRGADVAIGHVELPYTLRPARTGVNVTRSNNPEHLRGFAEAGFNVATLAGNHIWDAGLPGIEDTIDWLDANGLARTGAGRDLDDASRPVFIDREGVRFGILSFNSTGPRDGWATVNKAGSAYIHVVTHYDLDHDCPGGAPSVYSFPTYPALDMLKEQIEAAREQCDFLLVAIHKGILHTPVVLADYESPLARFAIDAGADMIVGHHAHILKPIEIYKGKPIFHGLGNFIFPAAPRGATVMLDQHPHSFTARRTRLYKFETTSPEYPFHRESQLSMVARCIVEKGKLAWMGFLPMLIDEKGRPRIVGRAEGGDDVLKYVERITSQSGFDVEYAWDGDAVAMTHGSGS